MIIFKVVSCLFFIAESTGLSLTAPCVEHIFLSNVCVCVFGPFGALLLLLYKKSEIFFPMVEKKVKIMTFIYRFVSMDRVYVLFIIFMCT